MQSSFAELRAEVFRRYGLGDWAGALSVLTQAGDIFTVPAEAARVIYWRACFLALLARPDEAIAALQSGLGRGLWWSEQMLRTDSDLRALQDDPAFQAIIAECRQRCERAQPDIQPARLGIEPPAPPPFRPLLALHAYGGNAAETLPHWSSAAERGWLVAALQSSQLAGMDGYHWVDEQIAVREVQQHLVEMAQRCPLDESRLVIGGFSNGGRTALLLALTGAVRARRVISVGGALRDETLAALDWGGLAGDPPHIHLIVGALDTPVLERMTQQAEQFRAHGLPVQLAVIPDLGHALPPDFAERLLAALPE